MLFIQRYAGKLNQPVKVMGVRRHLVQPLADKCLENLLNCEMAKEYNINIAAAFKKVCRSPKIIIGGCYPIFYGRSHIHLCN
ncbi:MAG TPA: hypothetical protein VJ065_01765 [Patescibacteria group bacterium]|nr:hypothetical protein [Patescibacteria group bacterium]